jgi:hypothetical protein
LRLLWLIFGALVLQFWTHSGDCAESFKAGLVDGSVLLVNGKTSNSPTIAMNRTGAISSSISFLISAAMFRMRRRRSASNHSFFVRSWSAKAKSSNSSQRFPSKLLVLVRTGQDFSRSAERRATGATMGCSFSG